MSQMEELSRDTAQSKNIIPILPPPRAFPARSTNNRRHPLDGYDRSPRRSDATAPSEPVDMESALHQHPGRSRQRRKLHDTSQRKRIASLLGLGLTCAIVCTLVGMLIWGLMSVKQRLGGDWDALHNHTATSGGANVSQKRLRVARHVKDLLVDRHSE